MNDIFFTADLHIGHKRILEFCSETRQGSCVEEHDEILIESWNSVVKPGSVVYILGDECLGDRDYSYSQIARLNGSKHLIKGNHTQLKKPWQKELFADIKDYKKIFVTLPNGNKQQIIMFHFPIISWENMHHGSWHLHGHCHGSLKNFGGKMLDVGLDTRTNRDMKPWSLEEVTAYMDSREIRKWDHH